MHYAFLAVDFSALYSKHESMIRMKEMRELKLRAPDCLPALLGVAIVNYYSAESVGELLESLASFADGVKIIVSVLDNSDDHSQQEIKRVMELSQQHSTSLMDVAVLRAPRNLGYGAGNNFAARYLIDAGANFIWILNPDTRVRGRAVNLLTEVGKSPADVWSTLTIERNVHTRGLGTLNTVTGKGRTSNSDKVGKRIFSLDYPAGHSILFRGAAWTKLGGFDERYFLFMEEADMYLRAHSLRLGFGTITSVTVEHEAGLTTGSTPDVRTKSMVTYREATKSRILFFCRHFPARVPLVAMLRVTYAAFVFARGNRVGALAVISGLLEGIRRACKQPIHGTVEINTEMYSDLELEALNATRNSKGPAASSLPGSTSTTRTPQANDTI